MLNTCHAKSLCAKEVRLFEPQFLASIACHYKTRIWPGTTDEVGAKGKVTSSNQDSKNKVATLVCSKGENFNPAVRFVVCTEHFTDDCFVNTEE